MNARKWRVVAPLALTAVGALVTGVAVLLQKTPKQEASEAAAPAAKPVDPARCKTGSYSFISGFQNAATVEMQLPYDPQKHSFAVIEEEFLSESSDPQVAVLYADEFILQLESAAYYGGESWQAHCAALKEKHPELTACAYGENRGVWYRNGDNVAVNLTIPGDASSYLLVTIIKTADFDGEVTELPSHPELAALLSGLRFVRS